MIKATKKATKRVGQKATTKVPSGTPNEEGTKEFLLWKHSGSNAAEVLEQMANTYRERNIVYGDNYKVVGEVMKSLFPNGMELQEVDDYNIWHLFELMIVKITRFANSNLSHKDSIHDAAVYAAMVEALMKGDDDE
jgi:hypothetical protein